MHKHAHSNIYTHTTNINKGEENKNLKPTAWDFVPSLYTFACDSTGSGETGKEEGEGGTGQDPRGGRNSLRR